MRKVCLCYMSYEKFVFVLISTNKNRGNPNNQQPMNHENSILYSRYTYFGLMYHNILLRGTNLESTSKKIAFLAEHSAKGGGGLTPGA